MHRCMMCRHHLKRYTENVLRFVGWPDAYASYAADAHPYQLCLVCPVHAQQQRVVVSGFRLLVNRPVASASVVLPAVGPASHPAKCCILQPPRRMSNGSSLPQPCLSSVQPPICQTVPPLVVRPASSASNFQ